MSNDVADDTQSAEGPVEIPLQSLGLVGAIARAMETHQKDVIKPKKDAPLKRLVGGYIKTKQPNLVVMVNGQEVGHYKVNTTNDRFEISDQGAFDKYAEDKDELDIVITAKPAFVDAMLKRAVRDAKTGLIVDSETGEVIPGLAFVSGGQPTGTLTWTWKKHRGRNVGMDFLLAAYRSGQLDDLLQEWPELMAGSTPAADE
ncbi:hypothetical protein ACIQVL_03705 [Streptomyces sp. NPDC090499]|uniref:hypothetical protein n=1 Tax=Streptomyces sp. NPDC090499 TaxID=3365965 RepID=UPI0037F3FA16